MKYCPKIIQPLDFLHYQVFSEVYEFIICGLKNLKHEVVSSENYNLENVRYIILGANLLKFIPKEKRPIFKKDTIIINLERFGHQEIFDQDYLDILKSFEVWDFSSLNMKRINFQYNLKIKKFLPLGYVKELEKIKKKEDEREDIDVLFIGSLSDRRTKILQEMSQLNINVKHLFGFYGHERDKIILRSKLLLNMHYHDIGSLEHVRIFYYLINSKPVLSEKSDDEQENEIYKNAICLQEYKNLSWKALELLNNDNDLKRYASLGHEFIKKQNFIEKLKENLNI
jgi:hypothetical protein